MFNRRRPLIAAALLLLWLAFGQGLVRQLGLALMRLDELPPVPGLGGQIFYAQGFDGLWRYDLNSGENGRWWSPPSGSLVSGVAVAPDAGQLAIAWAPPAGQGFQQGTTDLWLTALPEPDPVPLLTRSDILESWRDPFWSRDGLWLLVTHQQALRDAGGEPQSISITVKRVALDGSQETLLADAEQAALSPDGSQLTWLRLNPETWGQALMHAWADGSAAGELVAEGTFAALASPRFTKDGNFIVFSASGARQMPAASTRANPGKVRAHGDPWHIWQVDLASGELTRLTEQSLDGPMLAWSPTHDEVLAVLAAEGVFLRAQGRMWRVAASSAEGGLTWAPSP